MFEHSDSSDGFLHVNKHIILGLALYAGVVNSEVGQPTS